MSETEISQRYAQALFQSAQEQRAVDQVYEAVTNLSQLLEQTAPLREFINNPLLSDVERRKVLTALFDGKLPPLLMKFLFYINCKNRLNLLQPMLSAFDALYLKSHNRIRALIQTALPLEEEIKNAIKAQLNRKYGKEIVPQWQIRKDILGGFRIFVEGNLHEYSFTSQLEQFKQEALH